MNKIQEFFFRRFSKIPCKDTLIYEIININKVEYKKLRDICKDKAIFRQELGNLINAKCRLAAKSLQLMLEETSEEDIEKHLNIVR